MKEKLCWAGGILFLLSVCYSFLAMPSEFRHGIMPQITNYGIEIKECEKRIDVLENKTLTLQGNVLWLDKHKQDKKNGRPRK